MAKNELYVGSSTRIGTKTSQKKNFSSMDELESQLRNRHEIKETVGTNTKTLRTRSIA